jgi:membrane associated rhomboid family serine protease
MTDFQFSVVWIYFCYFYFMRINQTVPISKNVLFLPILFVITIWFVYWLEIKFSLNFTKYGILPRNFTGLRGVLLSPFIHSNTSHLFNNSIPLAVLLTSLVYFYKDVYYKVLLYGWILSGILTWVIAREAFHIGASGIVYLLFSFVFFSGIIKKHYQLVAVSLVVIFLYGSMIWYVLPIKDGVSWEGHLSGFLTGLFFAFLLRKKGLIKEKIQFKETEFDLLFDDDGNFNPPVIEEVEETELD